MSDFVHLHVHSEYSLLDGLSKIKKLVAKVKELEMPAVALTDHGVMYGAVEFYKECKAAGVKPLIGMEGYVVNHDHKLKEGKENKDNNHLVLLAKNYSGYKNLMKLSTIAHLEGFYYRPRFSKETLAQYSDGLICLSACPKGEIATLLVDGRYDQAKEAASWYLDTFGKDNYFLEIQKHNFQDFVAGSSNIPKVAEKLQQMSQVEEKWGEGIIKLSRDLGIPLVATNDSHYIEKSDATAQDALVCISTGKVVSEVERLRYVDSPTFYMKTGKEMENLFPEFPDAVKNTLKVAENIDVNIELGKWYFPNFEIPEGETAPKYLDRLSHERIKEKYDPVTPELTKRLEYELDVIITKGYAPYFLMMADMVNWCTSQRIITNTRGSAAGSIVSYVMGITNVDPIKYALPFERFLNPQRPKAPDIDLDVADDRRDDVIRYMVEKYGSDKVAQICTFGRMLARAAVRDIGRALGHPYAFPDKISKAIPLGSQGFPMTIEHALDISNELREMYDNDPQAKQLIDLAKEIEGNARHLSVHAAGVVVSPSDMTDFSPLQLEPTGDKIITQYEMHACEDVGLVKFDILGIRNLSILGAAVKIIKDTRGIDLDLTTIPIDDKETYQMLSDGGTMGTFQLGGSGMTKWLQELKPTRVEDIMAMIALFRPGPMAIIPEFIARKQGKSPITYLHPKMANYLDKSYGLLVYQEDILFTALELAGYDWGTVDALRQAIGKKKPKEMAEQHEKFVAGCLSHSGINNEDAEKLWDLFVPFQGYGFNKAHAASYGIVSYQTSYTKAHFPVEYMCALLTAESGDTDKIAEALAECKRMKIIVLPPDINRSSVDFTIEENEQSLGGRAIRFGLSAIKNIGAAAIDSILKARNAGDFMSLGNFAARVDLSKVNRKALESLIKPGAMDIFGKRAAQLLALDRIISESHKKAKQTSSGQTGLFDGMTEEADNESVTTDFRLPDVEEMSRDEQLNHELTYLGIYLSEHPMQKHLARISDYVTHEISDISEELHVGKTLTVGGIIISMRKVFTKKNNEEMAFITIQGADGGKVECVVFPKAFAAGGKSYWAVNNIAVVVGKVDFREEKISIIVDRIKEIL